MVGYPTNFTFFFWGWRGQVHGTCIIWKSQFFYCLNSSPIQWGPYVVSFWCKPLGGIIMNALKCLGCIRSQDLCVILLQALVFLAWCKIQDLCNFISSTWIFGPIQDSRLVLFYFKHLNFWPDTRFMTCVILLQALGFLARYKIL